MGGIRTVSGNYLTVVNNGGLGGPNNASSIIHTDAKAVGPWEKFRLKPVDAYNYKYAMQTMSGNYVTAVNGGGLGGGFVNDANSPIHTDATKLGPWESLVLVPQTDGSYAIRTTTGFYITAVNGGGLGGPNNASSIIHTDATAIGPWETFTFDAFKPAPSPVAIRTSSGRLLTVVNNGGLGGPNDASSIIHTDAKAVGPWEKFTLKMLDASKMTYALQTMSGNYLTAVNGGGLGGPNDASSPIHTDSTNVGAWESLQLISQADGTCGIRTTTGYYITAVNGGGLGANNAIIRTDATAINAWETFTIELR